VSKQHPVHYYLHFDIAAECHTKFILRILGEDSLKRLLEQRRVKRISNHHMSTAHTQ